MDVEAPRDLLRYFEPLDDPRHHNVRHELGDLLAIAILAVICGAEDASRLRKGRGAENFSRLRRLALTC